MRTGLFHGGRNPVFFILSANATGAWGLAAIADRPVRPGWTGRREWRVLTIVITDIKGFTERTSSTSREDLRKLIDEHEALLLPYVEQFGGKLVKTMGDAFLVAFESPTNAVLCAVMMQEKLREYNEDRPDELEMRVR